MLAAVRAFRALPDPAGYMAGLRRRLWAGIRAAVPDVGMGTPCAEEIYSLYAKGVLAGVDANLTFRPDGALTRAEAAAIVSRMARTEQRITLWNVSFFSRPAAQDALPAESAASEEAGPLPEEAPSP